MKHVLVLVTSVTLIVFAFARQKNFTANLSANNENDTTLAGTWMLQPTLPSDTLTGKVPTLTFNLTTQKFTGNTGCNQMSGHFFISGDSLTFDENMITTKMSCGGYNEKAFIGNLIKTNRYKIEDGVLQLMSDQTILSRWKRNIKTTMNKT
jgi:heat shock protein HslJ